MENLEKHLRILRYCQKTVSISLLRPQLILKKVTDPLYIDEVIFDQGDNEQDVKLVTLVQDAYFLFPQRDADGHQGKDCSGY